MWLLVAERDREVDLRALGRALGVSGRLSFGSERRLEDHLGVVPGAVTPFAVIHDTEGRVRVALDRGLMEHDLWNAHPLDNGMTTAVRREDMILFLEATGHPPVWVEL